MARISFQIGCASLCWIFAAGGCSKNDHNNSAAELNRPDGESNRFVSSFVSKRQSRTNIFAQIKNLEAKPTYELVESLGPQADERSLLEAYSAQTDFRKRRALTWILAATGGPEAAARLRKTVLEEATGRRFEKNRNLDEGEVLLETIHLLGFLAGRDDATFALLSQGTDPMFWKRNAKWYSDEGDDTIGQLTAFSIQAIGLSGRREVPAFLESLKSLPLVNSAASNSVHARAFYGSVVSAAFTDSLFRNKGRDYLMRAFYGSFEGFLAEWNEWKVTPEGERWRKWSADRNAKRFSEIKE